MIRHGGNLFIIIALLIFGIDAIGEWKWEDLKPLSAGLFFAVLGLAWGGAYILFDRRAAP